MFYPVVTQGDNIFIILFCSFVILLHFAALSLDLLPIVKLCRPSESQAVGGNLVFTLQSYRVTELNYEGCCEAGDQLCVSSSSVPLL